MGLIRDQPTNPLRPQPAGRKTVAPGASPGRRKRPGSPGTGRHIRVASGSPSRPSLPPPVTNRSRLFACFYLPPPKPLSPPPAPPTRAARRLSRATFKPGVRCSRRRSESPKHEVLGNLAHGCERRASVGNDIPAVQPVRDPVPRRCGSTSGSEGLPKSQTKRYRAKTQRIAELTRLDNR